MRRYSTGPSTGRRERGRIHVLRPDLLRNRQVVSNQALKYRQLLMANRDSTQRKRIKRAEVNLTRRGLSIGKALVSIQIHNASNPPGNVFPTEGS